MAKIVPLAERELAWARGRFAEYYGRVRVPPPPVLPRREFAAFPFAEGTSMRRHAALPTESEFRQFLTGFLPRHVYYSSAYYAEPDHPTMASKEWLGADLIFDLDADHLKGAESMSYAQQLALVKRQLVRLYDDFLLRDFGIDPAQAQIVFSGGRGYHVHVREERMRGLSSPERRELVDYLAGTEFDTASVIVEERHKDVAGLPARTFRRLAGPAAPGWPGRATRGLFETFERWRAQGTEAAAAELIAQGIERRAARQLAKTLVEEGGAAGIERTLRLDGSSEKLSTELFRHVLKGAALQMQGETDAPVTTDIHRLIRLPGSLHGGTGLKVQPIPREEVERFDPFRDALAPVGPAGPVEVVLKGTVDHPFDPPVRGTAGEKVAVSGPVGLFLVLRGEAELPA